MVISLGLVNITQQYVAMKILLIEDNPDLQAIISEALTKERYLVECAGTYAQASERVALYDYDCILLDIMLPDGDGLSLLQQLKQQRVRDSVIIISAKDSLDDKILGLSIGADDYLAKPFHIAELIARIRSVVRRKQNDGDVCIRVGNVTIFPDTFAVEVAGKPLELNRKEYDILLYFANRPNRLISKNTMAEAVWGDHIDQADNFDFIYAQIKNLRKKMKDAASSLQIKSVYGVGYKAVVEETE